MARIEIEVGKSMRSVLIDAELAWSAAEAGLPIEPSKRLSFVDWGAFCAVLTPRRFELIRKLRRQPQSEIYSLARSLGRDAKCVQQDFVVLADLGLVQRDPVSGAISTCLDEVRLLIHFAD